MDAARDRRVYAYGAGLLACCSLYYLAVVALGYAATRTLLAGATAGQYLFWGAIVALGAHWTIGEIRRPMRLLEDLDARPAVDEPVLEGLLARLAKQADVPAPDLWIAPVDEPNSLTVGYREPAVCVTEGLLEEFDGRRERLEAVFAHEVAHVANRDAPLMTAATVPGTFLLSVIAVAFVVFSLFGFLWQVLGDWYLERYVLPLFLGGIGLFACWLVLELLFEAAADGFSRRREFAADRAAAVLLGGPAGLAATLRELEEIDRPPETDLRSSSPVDRFCILPLEEHRPTHPPVAERIERLRAYQRTLETGGERTN